MKHTILATTLVSATMLLACDEGAPELEELNVAEQAVDSRDQIIASIEPDPDTKIYFLDSGVEGEPAIDVVIIGRDGGRDYGGLLGRDKATPLELYLAFIEDEQPIPEALQRAHDWQVARYRGPGEERDILKPAEADAIVQDIKWNNEPSTFTCLSWSNFQSYMATLFSGEGGRVQHLSTHDEWHQVVTAVPWGESEADMVVCNYDSPGDDDVVNSAACWINDADSLENCYYALLDDGHYLRRLYGEAGGNGHDRRYRVAAQPQSAPELQTFVGVVAHPE